MKFINIILNFNLKILKKFNNKTDKIWGYDVTKGLNISIKFIDKITAFVHELHANFLVANLVEKNHQEA